MIIINKHDMYDLTSRVAERLKNMNKVQYVKKFIETALSIQERIRTTGRWRPSSRHRQVALVNIAYCEKTTPSPRAPIARRE